MSNVFVYCWLGTQLTEQVNNTYLYFSMSPSIHILYVCMYKKQHSFIPGWKRERRSLGVRLGRNSCPIPALSGLHHCGSQQGVHTDSWEICSGVQLYHDECKKLIINYILGVVGSIGSEFTASVKGIYSACSLSYYIQEIILYMSKNLIYFLLMCWD
jgi:hypothetical protein